MSGAPRTSGGMVRTNDLMYMRISTMFKRVCIRFSLCMNVRMYICIWVRHLWCQFT